MEVRILSSAPFDSASALAEASTHGRPSHDFSQAQSLQAFCFCRLDDGIVVDVPWVYILRCSDDSLYIGHTDDVVAREATHNAGNGSHFLIGIIAGGVSLLVYSQRLTAFSFVRGASLVLAPLGAGLVMELLGRLLLARGYVRLALFTFKGGFWFALGMALLRFAYVEIG